MAKVDFYRVLCGLFLFCCFGCVLSENVATGTNHTFKPAIQEKFKSFDWRHNRNLVVEWDPSGEPLWYRYENRSRLKPDTADLSLILMKADSGVFECHYVIGEIVKTFQTTIEVLDPVPKPEVTCQEKDKNATLLCSVTSSVLADFTWEGPNGFSHAGKSLQITRKQNDADSIYYCTVYNKVSKKTTEIKLQLCDRPDTDSHVETNVGAIVGPIIAIIVLGAAVATGVVFYCKKKRGTRMFAVNHNSNSTDHPETNSSDRSPRKTEGII